MKWFLPHQDVATFDAFIAHLKAKAKGGSKGIVDQAIQIKTTIL